MRFKVLFFSFLVSWQVYSYALPELSQKLFHAVMRSDSKAVQKFLKEGADPNFPFKHPSPLLYSLMLGNTKVVKMLLDAGADPNASNNSGDPALAIAFDYKNTKLIQMLLKAGANPNVFTIAHPNSKTPLLVDASEDGKTEVVKMLLDAGADPNIDEPPSRSGDWPMYGTTALMSALDKGHTKVVKMLVKKIALLSKNNKAPSVDLLIASGERNFKIPDERRVKIVKILLKAGVDPNLRDKHERTALLCSVGFPGSPSFEFPEHSSKIVKMLLDAGADPNAKYKKKKTALMRATRRGSSEIVKMLLDAGAEPNAKDKFGMTALMYVSWTRILSEKTNREIVKMLLKAGAKSNVFNRFGNTALSYASSNGYTETVKMLLKALAESKTHSHTLSKIKYKALMEAVDEGYCEIAKVLLKAGALLGAGKGKRKFTYGKSYVKAQSKPDEKDIMAKCPSNQEKRIQYEKWFSRMGGYHDAGCCYDEKLEKEMGRLNE